MVKSLVCLLAVACFSLAACASDPGERAEKPRENRVLSAFLEKQGFELGISAEQARSKYGLTSVVDQRNNVFANPDITHRSPDPENVLPVLPTQLGFYDGVIRNDSLVVLQKCILIEPGLVPPKDAIEAFVKAYGLKEAMERRRLQRSSSELMYGLLYHGVSVRLVFRPCYDDGRTLHILTLASTY